MDLSLESHTQQCHRPKRPRCSALHPSRPTPWQSLILSLHLFQNVIGLEPYGLQPFQIGIFHLVTGMSGSSTSSQGSIAHFFKCWMIFHCRLDHSSLIHSPMEIPLGCFLVWAVLSKAAITIQVQGFVGSEYREVFGQIPRCATAGPFGKSMFTFVGNGQTVFLSQGAFLPAVRESSRGSLSSPALGGDRVWVLAPLIGVQW